MRVRKTGRYLAPLALLAVIVAIVVVVQSGLTTTHHAAPQGPTFVAIRHLAPKKRFYRVRPGDTLSTISVKTGVPVATLQSLNPRMTADPNALQTGQSLRLR